MKSYITLIFALLIVIGNMSCPELSYTDFTIAVYPDSQNEVDSYVPIWRAQNRWVVDNISAENIVAVLGVGDITNYPSVTTYTNATVMGYDLVDAAGLPYLPLAGNHDYNDLLGRSTSIYDNFFGPARFAGKSWYLGGYPVGSNGNLAIAFEVGDLKYLIIGLELFPREIAVAWAQKVIDTNPDREVIVVTHAYLTKKGALYQDSDNYGPAAAGLTQDYNGQELWDNFIKLNSRIFLVIGAHDSCNPNNAQLISSGTNGNIVSQIYSNYQCYANGGDGYILLLKFKTTEKVIEVNPYSTYQMNNDPITAPYIVPYNPSAPTISSVSAAPAPQSDIILSGMINDNGAATTVNFEYGLTTAYGTTVVGGTVNAGSGNSEIFASINGLAAGGTYHARAIASNIAGTVSGNDISFTITESTIQWPIMLSFTGPGRGAITSIPAGIYCAGTCATELNDNSTVQFIAIPDNFSIFSNWSDDCSGFSCTLTMNSGKSVIAVFTAAPLVMEGTTVYQNLGEPFNGALANATIKALAVEFNGDLTLSRDISIFLDGGHTGNFIEYAGMTTVKGSLIIEKGTVSINRVILQ